VAHSRPFSGEVINPKGKGGGGGEGKPTATPDSGKGEETIKENVWVGEKFIKNQVDTSSDVIMQVQASSPILNHAYLPRAAVIGSL
jgi:hypothetical protein